MNEFVTCLTATYGRYSRVCEALACFLRQDYPHKKLIILNNHSVPLIFEHPDVLIYNESIYPTLGHCRNRLLNLVDSTWINCWDDDDLFLPWYISQHVENIGEYKAWKPKRSWFTNQGQVFSLAGNAMEASILFRTEAVREIGGYAESMGDEHSPLLAKIKVEETEMEWWSSYCYTWGCGQWHASGSLGLSATIEERTKTWCEHNQDVKPGIPLIPAYSIIDNWFTKMSAFVPVEIREEWLRKSHGK